MKRTVSIAVFATCLAISGYALATSTSQEKNGISTTIESSQMTENSVFRGIIKKLDKGTALFTEKEVYPLIGGDFETIIGKEVNIVGKIMKEGDIEKIAVARVQFAKN